MHRGWGVLLAKARELPVEELPSFLGDLERIRATALSRLTAPAIQPHKNGEVNRLSLNVEEIAATTGLTPRFIYEHTAPSCPEPMPHMKVGKFLLFRREDVEKWLLDHAR